MSLKLVIQDAAEHVFAAHGFEGTSMRLIAERAGVAQALLHYHFKNKATLFASLFERRSSPTNTGRLQHLDALLKKKQKPTLEDILESMLLPPAAIGKDHHGGDYELYQQLVTNLSFSNDQRSKALMVRYYDPIARRFIAEFQKAVPGLSEAASIWSYLFALGARHEAQSKTGRGERLRTKKSAKGGPSPTALLLPFIAAGIRALARAPQTSPRNRKANSIRPYRRQSAVSV